MKKLHCLLGRLCENALVELCQRPHIMQAMVSKFEEV